MLIVLTNVLWSGCHFWADLNCPPELNCTVNYHIIAFSAVIYVHIGAGVLQLVGRGISTAGLTPNTAGCFSTGKHQSLLLPPHPPSLFLLFSFSLICSLSLFLFYVLSFIHSLLYYPSVFLRAMLSLHPLYFPSSIIYLGCIWRDDSEVPSGLYSSSASFIGCMHIHMWTLTFFSVCQCVFFFSTPAFGIDIFSLHLLAFSQYSIKLRWCYTMNI